MVLDHFAGGERCDYRNIDFIDILRLVDVKHLNCAGREEAGWSPPVKYFTDRSKAVLLLWIIHVISVVFLLCVCGRMFFVALWSPAGKGLTSWLSFVMSNCEIVTFPLVSCVRCGTWLNRFLIFALFLTLNTTYLVFQVSCLHST